MAAARKYMSSRKNLEEVDANKSPYQDAQLDAVAGTSETVVLPARERDVISETVDIVSNSPIKLIERLLEGDRTLNRLENIIQKSKNMRAFDAEKIRHAQRTVEAAEKLMG